MLQQAIDSVYAQTANEYVTDPIVVNDHHRHGAAWSVGQGVVQVQTEWLTLLGDDDWLLPEHHAVLMQAQRETGADVVYGTPVIVDGDGENARPCWNIDYNEDTMRQQSIVPGGGSLIRTELLQRVGVPQVDHPKYGRQTRQYDDWGMYLALLDGGATFAHIPDVLYAWRHWSGNTSGKGDR